MEKITELKPCPFCGGESELRHTGKLKMQIRCKACHIGLEQKVLRLSLEWLETKLIERWNTRLYSGQAIEQTEKL